MDQGSVVFGGEQRQLNSQGRSICAQARPAQTRPGQLVREPPPRKAGQDEGRPAGQYQVGKRGASTRGPPGPSGSGLASPGLPSWLPARSITSRITRRCLAERQTIRNRHTPTNIVDILAAADRRKRTGEPKLTCPAHLHTSIPACQQAERGSRGCQVSLKPCRRAMRPRR